MGLFQWANLGTGSLQDVLSDKALDEGEVHAHMAIHPGAAEVMLIGGLIERIRVGLKGGLELVDAPKQLRVLFMERDVDPRATCRDIAVGEAGVVAAGGALRGWNGVLESDNGVKELPDVTSLER
jgi:hypothetical protein